MTVLDPIVGRQSVPPLVPGDKLDAKAFLARYRAMPDGTKAELIEGIVYMPPPASDDHSTPHGDVVYWLKHFARFTPGVAVLNEGTVVLGRRSQPQPDAGLRVLVGGQTRLTPRRRFVRGCPELVVEVANSAESIDLHAKRRDYDRHGAREYVVVLVRHPRVVWFARDRQEQLVERAADADGLHRSATFPGLWLDPAALLAGDLNRLAAAVEAGVATPGHAAFVADLASRTANPAR